jgi:hypothetical protein
MKNELNNSKTTKKTYQKPSFRQVRLRPEEAVLGACKTGSGSGGLSGGTCVNMGLNCNAIGS